MQTILAVDDAKDTLMLLEFDLQAEGYQVVTTNDGLSALSRIEHGDIDLVLLDLYMPDFSGLQTLQAIRENPDFVNVPVVMLSASDDEDEIVEALELGAHDYVTKPYIAKVLLARIRNALRLRENSLKLENLAHKDHLTELNNKGHFEELANKSISHMSRQKENIAIAMVDIDHFKNVNDTYGHDAGDNVLSFVAKLLEKSFRDYDIVGRVGGEEFAVCMPHTENQDAFNACERFRKKLANAIIPIGGELSISVTTSIGVASANSANGEYDFKQLMHTADEALYEAKATSRNVTISHFSAMLNKEQSEVTNVSSTEESLPTESVSMGNLDSESYTDSNASVSNASVSLEDFTTEDVKMTEVNSVEMDGIDYQIGVGNVLGDDDLFREILQMFHDDHHQDGEKIQQAITSEDYAQLKSVVHTLKGVSSSIGAMELFEQTKLLDIAINQYDADNYQRLFENVSFQLTRVISTIKKELNI